MKIILPLPPSDNRRLIFAPHLGRMVASSQYRGYKKIAQEILMIKTCVINGRSPSILRVPTFENQMRIKILIFLKDKRRDAIDILKPLLDVMTGYIYTDDKWVVPYIYPYQIDKNNPRVEVEFEASAGA